MKKSENFREKYEGQVYCTKDTGRKFTIIKFNSYNDVVIKFENGIGEKHVQMGAIINGITDPFKNTPIIFDSPKQEYEGSRWQTNEGYVIYITKYESSSKVHYKFLDEFGYEGVTTTQNIKKGQVKNPYKRSECGSYLGESPYIGKEYEWLHQLWRGVVYRGTGFRKHWKNEDQPYANDFVANSAISSEWMCYANFAEWYLRKLSELNPNCKYELNKDILIYVYGIQSNGIRFYGPDTVELIPEDLNTILFNNKNAPKSEEARVRVSQMADTYYSQKMLSDRAYCAIKRFFCGDLNYPVYQSVISLYDQQNLLKNNIYFEGEK